jgi:hypothetical protein
VPVFDSNFRQNIGESADTARHARCRRYSGMEHQLAGTFVGLESPPDFFALTHCSRCQPNDPHDSAGEEQDVVRGASRARIP